ALCTAKTGGDALQAVESTASTEGTVSAFLTTGFIAAGSDVQIIVDRTFEASEKLVFGALLKPGDPSQASQGQAADAGKGAGSPGPRSLPAAASELPSLITGPQISVRVIDPNDWRVTEHRVLPTATVATLLIPPVPWSLWGYSTLYFWACK